MIIKSTNKINKSFASIKGIIQNNFDLIQISTFMRNRLLLELSKISFYKKASYLIALLFVTTGISLNAQCTPDVTTPVFVGCNGNRTVTLSGGKCEVYLQPSIYATDNCTGKTATVSHNASNANTAGYGCVGGTTNFYQLFTSVSPTPMRVTNVSFGVFNSVGSYNVPVRVYRTDGTLVTANWELIGTSFAPNVTGSGSASAILNSDLIFNGEIYAIEIITPSSISGDLVMAYNTGAQSGNTYVKANACGVTSLTNLASLTAPSAGAVVNVTTQSQAVYVYPNNGNTYETTDVFEAGIYNLSYEAVDASGLKATCGFTLTVNGVANPVSSISCNDLVNISLDDECMAEVGADEILEGGPYSCYDDYQVVIYNLANKPIGNILNASHVGLKLKVEVVAPNNNRCWGEIKVEDKNPPVLECADVYTSCSGSLEPGSSIPSNITFAADLPNKVISSGPASSKVYTIDVFGLTNVNFTDINVMIDIDHANVSELTATLEGPNGKFVTLFDGLTCTNGGLFLTLDDQASATFANLQSACNAVSPAIMGAFKAKNALSTFMTGDPTGIWKLTINDGTPGNGGTINNLAIVFTQSGGKIPFPTTRTLTSATLVGPKTYRVIGLDPCGPATVSYQDEVVDMSCDSKYLKILDRTWNAVDGYGNTALTCVQRIYVYRNGLATLIFPPNYDGKDRPTFSCTDWGMTVPPPTPAGAGYPSGDFCDNIQIFDPVDTKIDICAKSYKIIRQWKVVEWCNSQVIEHTQIIKVEDKQGPILDCKGDVTLSTDPLDCSLDYTPEKPTFSDRGCSAENEIVISLSYYVSPSGNIPSDAIFIKVIGTKINDLPLGITFIRYTATDDCGNMSICEYKITVIDEVPPVAVCDQFTNVSVGSDGNAWVDALTFDDYSHDNCELVKFEVRKMTNACSGGSTSFGPKVLFCCLEVGKSIMVALQVTDKSGNKNTCMVEAKIEDKLPPYIQCPKDITLACFADYENLTITGEAQGFDNCTVASVNHTDSGAIDNCGEGVISRTWTAKELDYDGPGGQPARSASCVQRITLRNDKPFTRNDIKFPANHDAFTCNSDLSPENLPNGKNFPTIVDKACSLTSYDYKDQVFTFVDGSCAKILRTWTVIDWCTYNKNNPSDPNDDTGIYSSVQIIKLTNTIPPVFANCSNKTADINGACKGEVTQSVSATDDCTPTEDITYEYIIDVNNDGVGPHLTGNSNTFTRILDIGTHKITWYAYDRCGNRQTCMYLLTVRDGKKPTPYCLTTITTVVMPSTNSLEIWASDFDYGSYDNCTATKDLTFSFTSSKLTTNRTFTCADIPDGKEMYIPITMWVHDLAGNKDFCSIGLILQDGIGDVCDDITRFGIAGKITTESNSSIQDVEVQALTIANESMISRQMTGADGVYSVNVAEGDNVNIVSNKADHIMNGISTLDLVLIQRHILAITPFTSAYKSIAADVSNDGRITASDLVALRKVILGIDSAFPNNQKVWRFVDKNQKFNDITKPFPFKEKFDFSNVNSSSSNVNFIGMKIGDVNGSVKLNARAENTENRTQNTMALDYDMTSDNGYTYINVYARESNTLAGIQAQFVADGNEIVGLESGLLDVSSGDYVITNGTLKMSHATKSNVAVNNNEPIFTLIVKGAKHVKMQLTNDAFTAEAYNTNYEVSDLTLGLRSEEGGNEFFLMQNRPNPFTDFTTINFVLPTAGKATLEVFDVTGKKVYNKTTEYPKGDNQIELNANQLGETGILYYQLTFGQNKAIKKMVNVK